MRRTNWTSHRTTMHMGVSALLSLSACKKAMPSTAVSSPYDPSTAPAQDLATGRSYARVFPGAYIKGVGIHHDVAAWNVSADGATAHLDALGGTVPGPTQTIATQADPATVKMAPAGPDPAMFADTVVYSSDVDPQTGLGAFFLADLSQTTIKPIQVPGSDKSPPGSICFGPTGHQVLFLSQYVSFVDSDGSPTQGGHWFWWDTSTATPLALNSSAQTDVSPAEVALFNSDHSQALIATHYSAATGTGTLVLVDLQNGSTQVVDDQVALFASTFLPTTGNSALDGNFELGFSATPSLSAIAYSKISAAGGFELHLFTPGTGANLPLTIAASGQKQPVNGIFPTISASGQTLAFWDYSSVQDPTADSALLRVWRASDASEIFAVPVKAALGPALCPVISPDDAFLGFFTGYVARGHSVYGSSLGSLTLISTSTMPDPQQLAPIADAVAVHSVAFQPGKASATKEVLFLADFVDLTRTVTFDGSTGKLYAGDLSNGIPAKGLTQGIDTDLAPGQVFPLSHQAGVLYQKGPGDSSAVAHPYVWLPGMAAPRQLDAATTGDAYVAGTLSVMPLTAEMGLTPGDGFLYLSVAPGSSLGTLYAADLVTGNEGPVPVASGTTFAGGAFSTDGRVIGLNSTGVSTAGTGDQVTIREMPLP